MRRRTLESEDPIVSELGCANGSDFYGTENGADPLAEICRPPDLGVAFFGIRDRE